MAASSFSALICLVVRLLFVPILSMLAPIPLLAVQKWKFKIKLPNKIKGWLLTTHSCTSTILLFCANYQQVYQFLPDEVDIKKCPKQWVVDIIYSVICRPFAEWVKAQIEARNRKIAVEGNLLINMDAEIAEAYARSTAVSSK